MLGHTKWFRPQLQGFIEKMRLKVGGLSVHPVDPFVATVAGAVAAEFSRAPREDRVCVDLPDYYEKKVEVSIGAQRGQDSAMLVILPGVYSDEKSAQARLLKQLAWKNGMNYTVIANSASTAMLRSKPRFHPGNPRLDAVVGHKILEQLSDRYPRYFKTISVVGYSYGGLLAANLVRYDEEQKQSLISGNLVSSCPPVNYANSMRRFDELREEYQPQGSLSIWKTLLGYRNAVQKFGYEAFQDCPLATRESRDCTMERLIADEYGSRGGLRALMDWVDRHQGSAKLPLNREAQGGRSYSARRADAIEHARALEGVTYRQMEENLNRDPWMRAQGETFESLAVRYSLTSALSLIRKTPTMVLASQDDYILKEEDVAALRAVEAQPAPNQVVKVLNAGGHVGAHWNPEIREAMIRFLRTPLDREGV